ncbi:hypothetical protein LCGC14_2171070, partial [marine sediment metagenome]
MALSVDGDPMRLIAALPRLILCLLLLI